MHAANQEFIPLSVVEVGELRVRGEVDLQEVLLVILILPQYLIRLEELARFKSNQRRSDIDLPDEKHSGVQGKLLVYVLLSLSKFPEHFD